MKLFVSTGNLMNLLALKPLTISQISHKLNRTKSWTYIFTKKLLKMNLIKRERKRGLLNCRDTFFYELTFLGTEANHHINKLKEMGFK